MAECGPHRARRRERAPLANRLRASSTGPVSVLIVFLLATAGASTSASDHQESGTVATQVAIANAPAEVVHWDVIYERALGMYGFEVTAEDKNGVPDLERLVLVLRDDAGNLVRHEESEPQAKGTITGTWRNLLEADDFSFSPPIEVTIEIHERAGDVLTVQGEARPLVPCPARASYCAGPS